MSKVIKILGTGCPKCKTLTALVTDVVAENNMDATIVKVEDIMEIMEYNVMTTPALVIDNEIAIKGRVPSKDEILALLKTNTPVENNEAKGSCCSGDSCC